MSRTLIALSALAVGTALTAPVTAAQDAPLIERAKLYGNPAKSQARLSPDGKHIAWIAPRDGVMNIWVAPFGNLAAARSITSERTRPIRQYYWAPDSGMILYVQDKGGDENNLLYGVDLATGAERSYTPFQKTRATIVAISPLIMDRILIGLNNRDPRWHDIFSLDLKTGKLTELLKTDGFDRVVVDEALAPRLAIKPNTSGGNDYFRITGGKVEDKPYANAGLADSWSTRPIDFTADGKTLYWLDSRGRDKIALVAEDTTSGVTNVIAHSPKADVQRVLTDPKTGVVQAWGVDYLRNEWTAVDAGVSKDFAFLKTRLEGDIDIGSRTDADDRWIVTASSATAPATVWLFDRKAQALTQLYASRPDLAGAPLVEMHPREIRSRDGLVMISYLSLPPGSDANGDGKPEKPVPLVLLVHGGPYGRDTYGFDAEHQWLANRGYAVLSVNYRGSTGFGKNFVNASNLQWGLKMHDDLIDGVDWAIAQGITTPEKVAIYGGSYGGYATLAGVTFTPTKFACGVEYVGPSNLETLMKTIPPYWVSVYEQFRQRMGDPHTSEGVAILKAASPLWKADKIVRPLLIAQGANDPRVNQAESDQIVSAMRAKNIPVTYMLFPDEGHGFARPVNNIAFKSVAESFLSKCLGGRVEPIGDTVKRSSAKVPYGAEFAPGLSAALQ